MCGRYFFGDRTADEVEKELGLRPGSISPRPGDATPGMILPGIVRRRNGEQNQKNGVTYLDLMQRNAEALKEALG